MRKFTERHKQLLKEIEERNDFIVAITEERIGNKDAAIPIDYMLESRFNELRKQAINIEAKINFIMESDDYHTAHVEGLKDRLKSTKGAMTEILSLTELIVKLGKANRDFEVVS